MTGMRYPSIDKLLVKVGSKYLLVNIVSKRVIKHDQLIEKMKEIEKKSSISFTEETIYKISNILLKYNKEYSIDYSKMYNIDSFIIIVF